MQEICRNCGNEKWKHASNTAWPEKSFCHIAKEGQPEFEATRPEDDGYPPNDSPLRRHTTTEAK